jgi:hypothetical protein
VSRQCDKRRYQQPNDPDAAAEFHRSPPLMARDTSEVIEALQRRFLIIIRSL